MAQDKVKLEDMKIDFNAMCEFEKLTGKSLQSLYKTKNFAMNDIRAIVKGSLGLDEEEEAGDIIVEYVKENGFDKFSNLFSQKMEEFNNEFDKKK